MRMAAMLPMTAISNALRSLLNLKIDANLHDIIRIRFYVAHLHLEIGSLWAG